MLHWSQGKWVRSVFAEPLELDIDYKTRSVKVNGSTYKEGDYLSINGTTGEIFAGELKTAPSKLFKS